MQALIALGFSSYLRQVWSSAAEIASAYCLGRTEAAAAQMLVNEVDVVITNRLESLVRLRIGSQ